MIEVNSVKIDDGEETKDFGEMSASYDSGIVMPVVSVALVPASRSRNFGITTAGTPTPCLPLCVLLL